MLDSRRKDTAPASRIIAAAVALTLGACSLIGSPPGETRTDGRQQRAVSARVLELAEKARPSCRKRDVTDTEIVDLYGDGKVSVERWTVTQCGERSRYLVNFPPSGRGTGFTVQAENRALP